MYVTCNYMYLSILYTFIRIYTTAPPSPSAKSSIFVARHFPRKLMIQDRVLCTCSNFLFPLSYPYLLRYRPHPIPFLHATFSQIDITFPQYCRLSDKPCSDMQVQLPCKASNFEIVPYYISEFFFHFIEYSFYMLKIIFRYACSNL